MTQFQLAFDFSAPAEPVLLGLDAETIEALANDSLPEISIPEIIARITEPEQPPISKKPKCQILVVPEREAPRGLNRDYRITDADEIGAGGLKAKFENNLAAIRLLKQLEQEKRIEATPEEKRTLVRYCGWGALAQKAFSYNYEFYDLQRVLQELLTEEEHTQASASTVNAHYTSPMVINAIWRAARRLGIQAQSRILEPAAGIGHFLGLQPEEIKSNSRVAVEIDATSAAILRLLYPDTIIRACGFQQPGLPLNFFDLATSNVPFGKYGVHDIQFKSKPRLCSAIHDYFFANLRRAEFNHYNLEVMVAITRLCRQNLEMLGGLGRMAAALKQAQIAANSKRPEEVLSNLDRALDMAVAMREQRNQVLSDTTTTWYKSWEPRVAEANGRRFLNELDDVKDHLPDRTVDMSYLVYREMILPFEAWVAKVQAVRNDYARQHALRLREESFNWMDLGAAR